MSQKIVSSKFNLNQEEVPFFFPENDDTIMGTFSCLQNNKFHLTEIPFAPGDVFVDIGSNVGLLSLVVAKTNPDVRVLAFDASPLAIKCLKKSIAANGITNLEAYNVAVGANEERDVKFYSNNKDTSCLVQDGLNKDNKTLEATVNMIAIDEIFDSLLLDVKQVKLAKFDAEGAEFKIFERLFLARRDILSRIEYLHLEVHQYSEFDPKNLETKVKEFWGSKVFFDT